jgi:hypothetical protein
VGASRQSGRHQTALHARATEYRRSERDHDVLWKAAKQILTTSAPGSAEAPYGVWTGTAEDPFAVTFKLKGSYVDMTGLANICWFTKTSGFHAIRPVVKLANGNLLVT